jgi:hypothetical protein
MIYQIYESGNYLIIDTYDEVARVVTASAQYAKKNSYYNKTVDGYVITEFGGGEFAITSADIAANLWTDNAAVPLSESEIVDILQNHTGNFKSAGGSSSAFVGATLLKTGQTTSYRTGDDGGLQAGRAVDFFTLPTNNPFGNTNRFTDELGGATYANDIVIDWSAYDNIAGTVLGYYRAALTVAAWSTQVDNCLAVSVGGYSSGWRMVNFREFFNIHKGEGNPNVNYAPFNINMGNYYWTSTSRDATFAVAILTNGSGTYASVLQNKGNTFQAIACRTFTVTGTTLT